MSVSGQSVIIRKITVPMMTPSELAEQIQWEAEQHIHFDIKDVQIDYEVLRRRPEAGVHDDAPAVAQDGRTLAALSERERAVLEQIARGLDNDEVAAALHLSEKTVRNYVTSIFAKLELPNRSRAIVWARDAGLGRAGDPQR